MPPNADFSLEITSQWWRGPYEDGSVDSCSHGAIRAIIGGVLVTSDVPESDYGIIQSALSLLRSLEREHPPSDLDLHDEFSLPEYLLGHGCGYPIGLGCTNFGTDWRVHHENGDVVLSEPLLVDQHVTKRFDVTIRIPLAVYRQRILAFALEARRFYFNEGPRHVDQFDVTSHELFWKEFDERLARARQRAP